MGKHEFEVNIEKNDVLFKPTRDNQWSALLEPHGACGRLREAFETFRSLSWSLPETPGESSGAYSVMLDYTVPYYAMLY